MDDTRRSDIVGMLAPLRRYARSLTRSEARAEDLVHDALLRAYERKESFRQDGALRTWLFSILHNVFIDDWRRREAETRRDEAHAALPTLPALDDPESRLRVKQVLDLFLTLPDEQRAALHLVAVEEMSYQEAADALGVPIGTLMSRLSRARATIREREAGIETPEHRRASLRIVGGAQDD